MDRVIEITFPNGEVWRIGAQAVTDARCSRFSNMGFPCIEADDEELIAFLQNDMDWIEVMRNARHTGLLVLYDYAVEFDEATFMVKGE